MSALGKALWIALIFVVMVGGSVLAFTSFEALQARNAAAPPNLPGVSLSPSLIPPAPPPAQTPTPAAVRPTLTTTPSPAPFPASPPALPNVSASLYVSREVVVVPVGAGPGQIGIKMYGPMPGGAMAFALDPAGNIYIADNANQRINKYGKEGTFVSGIPLPAKVAPWDLAVDAGGDIYVLDGANPNVLKLSPEGAVLATYASPQYTDGDAIALLKDGTLAVQGTDAQVRRLGTTTREFSAEEKGKTSPGFLYRDGVFRQSAFRLSPDRRWGVLEATLAWGRPLKLTVVLPDAIPGPIGSGGAQRPGEGTVGFHEVDGQGNYYVVVSIIYDEIPLRVDGWLLRYDASGALKAFLPLRPPRLYTVPNAFSTFRVAENGDVYVLVPLKDEVKVVRWEYRP